MLYKAEINLSCDAKSEINNLLDITKKIPPEKLTGFLEFLKGVNYGLDMAESDTAAG